MPAQRLPQLHPVIEGQVHAFDLLPDLVSAAGNQDGICCRGHFHSVVDRRAAEREEGHRGGDGDVDADVADIVLRLSPAQRGFCDGLAVGNRIAVIVGQRRRR